jgi:hypothetical protein
MSKQYSKPFHEVYGLNESQEKRVRRLVNYAKYRASIDGVLRSKKINDKEVQDLENRLKFLQSQPEQIKNKQFIHQTKKAIEKKQLDLKLIQDELGRLKKFSIKDKPENVVRELANILTSEGKSAKILTRIRGNFVTAEDFTRDSDKFLVQGRAYFQRSGIRSTNEGVAQLILGYEGVLNEVINRRVEFGEFKTLTPWLGQARVQTLGKGSSIQLQAALQVWINILTLIIKLPVWSKRAENMINDFANHQTRGDGYIIVGEIRLRYIAMQKTKVQYASGMDEADTPLYKFRNEFRPYSFPGQKPIEIKINGGINTR